MPQPDLEEVRRGNIPPGTEWYGEQMPKYSQYPLVTFLHVGLSILLLLSTPFLLSIKFREKNYKRHRLLGKTYIVLGLIVSLSSLYISFFFPFAGLRQTIVMVPIVGFFLFTLGAGFYCIKKRNFALHRIWMIRSVATILSPMTMRMIFVTGLLVSEINPRDFFMESFLIGLFLNLLVTEVYIKKSHYTFSSAGRVATN